MLFNFVLEMLSMAKLVSVIMPVYNAEKFVADAIQSVIQQSWTTWELLIVNDGSTDRSGEIITTFADPRIRYFEQANRGVSSARNVALRNMKGDFFCFLDADDIFPKDSLADRLKVFSQDENITFVDGTVDVRDSSLDNRIMLWRPSFRGYPFSKLIRLSESVFLGLTWMVKVKPQMLYQLEEEFTHAEDLFFYITMADQGKYDFTSAVTLNYRRNAGSAMSNLKGLANGYTLLRRRLRENFGRKLSLFDYWFLNVKTRKIMFLSFVRVRMFKDAFQYLLTGKILQ